MSQERTANLLGALALGLADGLSQIKTQTGHGGEAAAALVTLGVAPGISISTLRQILGLSHPGTVRLIDRLAAEGWVERRPGADGRTLALVLTEAGGDRRALILAARRQRLEDALSRLSPAEQTTLTPLLEKMLTALTTDAARADEICRLCEEEVCPAATCPVEQAIPREVTP